MPSEVIETNSSPQIFTIWNGAMGDPAALVNDYSVLSIPAFWAGVRFLSETLASLPKTVFRRVGSSRQAVDHPLNKLLARKANQYATPFVVHETWHAHAVVHGNGFLLVQRDPNTNAPIGYLNLNPQSVVPFRYGGAQWYCLRNGTLKNGEPANLILAASDVLHLPGLGFDGMVGYGVVELMNEAFELARNGQRFASRYFKKGTQVQGSIEIPGSVPKERIASIVDKINQSHSGLAADYGYTVLTEGAKLSNNTVPPEQSQLLESRQFSVVEMCRILRIPPHVVYDLSRATWANVELLGQEVVKYSLRPWVEKAEQELSSKLLTQAEQDNGFFIRYSVDSLLRGDTATQTSTTLSLVNGGVITANEGRARLDLPPLTDSAANTLRVPVNFPLVQPSGTPSKVDPSKSTPPQSGDEDANFQTRLPAMTFESLSPIVEDVISRIETKSDKAFDSKKSLPAPELTIWRNLFAEEQCKFAMEALAPVDAVLKSQTGKGLDVQRIGQRYASAIRMKFAGREAKSLSQIVEECFSADNDSEGIDHEAA